MNTRSACNDPIAVALQTVHEELNQLLVDVCIDTEVIVDLLDVQQTEFQRVSTDEGDRYWIPWTAYLGAWITADGQKITLLISEKATPTDLEGPLTTGLVSVIAGACINLRGQVAIHANAVDIEDCAIAFVGYSGMGKSTLSAYCASQGAGFITDDVLIIDRSGTVKAGIPRLKLYPHVGETLGLKAALHTSYKVYYHPTQAGSTLTREAVPLRLLYFLAESTDQRIYAEPVSPSQAVFDLLAHSYYAADLISSNLALLDSYIQVTTQTTVKQLFYPREFALLPKVYDFLRHDIQRL